MTSVRYRALEPHTPDPGVALAVGQGERLRFERRPTEWEGWLWCTAEGDRTGWVPESWVAIDGDMCRMRRAYDATELSVAAGDELTGELSESGWVYARNDRGDAGWVPLRGLQRLGAS